MSLGVSQQSREAVTTHKDLQYDRLVGYKKAGIAGRRE